MKKKTVFIILFLFSSFLYSQSDDITLSLLFNSVTKESITLVVKNNKYTDIQIPKTVDGSFWCLTKPCVKFQLEENINGTWTEINYDISKNMRCGNYSDWKKNNYKTTIKSGEKKNIGQFKFPNNLSGWFGFFGDKKLRLTVKYSVTGDEVNLSKYGYNKIELTSTPLEIDYINTKHPVNYLNFFNQLLSNNKLTKKRFRQGAKTIIYPGNKEKRLKLALKAFGIKTKNIEDKIVHHTIDGYTTDKTNPALITTNIINDNGIFYLVAFIRYTRYSLEKKYTKDFCKVYKIN